MNDASPWRSHAPQTRSRHNRPSSDKQPGTRRSRHTQTRATRQVIGGAQLFLTRVTTLVDQVTAFRMLGLHLERMSDIALEHEDAAFTQPVRETAFTGALKLQSIGFRYSPSDPMILHDLCLEILPGSHVAITGPSGGGKSTLAKLILGLVEPTAGKITIDGRPLGEFGHRNYRRNVAAVLQEDTLFAGSIAYNISLFDDDPDQDRIVEAASMAAMHGEIMAMPMRYESLVGDMGSALSGGQKARILLARALYRRPRLLVLDEGTAHLDPDTERAVNSAISALDITRVVIAHRFETISAADTVYRLLDGGLVQEAGTASQA